MGTSVNIVLVYVISRVKVITLVIVSTCITLISPALMATVGEHENYWLRPFWALFLCPVNPWGKNGAPYSVMVIRDKKKRKKKKEKNVRRTNMNSANKYWQSFSVSPICSYPTRSPPRSSRLLAVSSTKLHSSVTPSGLQ